MFLDFLNMIAGNNPEAFKDFSGGVNMNYKLSKDQPDLFDVMKRAFQCNAMLGCSTFVGVNHKTCFTMLGKCRVKALVSQETEMSLFQEKGEKFFEEFGLVDGHAFAVTGVRQV
ncbi:hypothetical protein GOODEAATRI_030703 [Goodea atripinnis]|uniref:Calpain catalytic domain-containing protein n=1 Tax=Goodea atripinnis TaxID=208336 RepID=A0ABV0NPH1_9TELE